jgi:hypothetical protein
LVFIPATYLHKKQALSLVNIFDASILANTLALVPILVVLQFGRSLSKVTPQNEIDGLRGDLILAGFLGV